MRNQQAVKLFLILTICTAYIFTFSQFGAKAYDSVIHQDDQFAEKTMVGSLSIAGKTKNEAIQLVDEQLTKWLNETTLTLKYKEKSEFFDLANFVFDVEAAVSQVQQGQNNPMNVELASLEDFLSSFSSNLNTSGLHMDQLQSDILSSAKMLEIGSYQFRLEDYLTDESAKELRVISESSFNLEENDSVIEEMLDTSIEIGAKTQFSFLDFIEDEELGIMSSTSLSKLATAIYEVILPTNFPIIERHLSNELPSYAKLGSESKVDTDLNQDLVFTNPNEFSYFIEFEKVDTRIKVYLKGPELLNRYVISLEDKESFKPKTIRQFNPQLKPTEIKVENEGREGQLAKVYREHIDEKGESLKKELISEDFYPPIHRIEVQGLIINEESTSTDMNSDSGFPDEMNGSNAAANEGNSSDLDPNQDIDEVDPQDYMKESDLWGKPNEIPK